MKKKITEAQATAAAKDWLYADVELQATQAEKRRETTAIVQKYEPIEKQHLAKKETAQAIIAQYAEENRETLLPKGAKSVGFGGATIGWKQSPASLRAINGDWDTATEKIKEFAPDFIIEKTELDKAGLLRNADNLTDILADAGLEVARTESFYVKA